LPRFSSARRVLPHSVRLVAEPLSALPHLLTSMLPDDPEDGGPNSIRLITNEIELSFQDDMFDSKESKLATRVAEFQLILY
jgi:hypothetical protein